MPAGKYDFSRITQGDTIEETFTFKVDADTPYDLTGATIRTQFRTAAVDQGGSVVIDATAYWAIDADPTTGIATLTVPASVSATISTTSVGAGETLYLVYDIEIEDASGNVATWLAGRLPVTPQVTA
jgi:hypothetical protein